MLVLSLLSACGSAPLDASALPPTATTAAAQGDWDDVDAAVAVAASRCEMAVLSVSSPTPCERLFSLRTINDQPALLLISRPEAPGVPSASGSFTPLIMRCSVGRFGDRAQEDRLTRSVRARIRQLAGVDVASVD